LLAASWAVQAANPVVPLEGAAYRTEWGLVKNLEMFSDKNVRLTLKSGHVVAGKVKKVDQHLVHIQGVSGSEFYDALILVDEIAAMEAQFRAYQSDIDRMQKK